VRKGSTEQGCHGRRKKKGWGNASNCTQHKVATRWKNRSNGGEPDSDAARLHESTVQEKKKREREAQAGRHKHDSGDIQSEKKTRRAILRK